MSSQYRRFRKKLPQRMHVVDTEVRDFDTAVELIAARATQAKRAATLKEQARKKRLRPMFAVAGAARIALRKKQGRKISLAPIRGAAPIAPLPPAPKPKPVDPFAIYVTDEQKAAKAREMYATHDFTPREIAARLHVRAAVVKEWLGWGLRKTLQGRFEAANDKDR